MAITEIKTGHNQYFIYNGICEAAVTVKSV